MSISILANHAHVFPASINADATIERLLRLLDACGIAQAVCFAPFPPQCDGHDLEPNGWLAAELKKHDRLLGFGTIDFRRANVKEQIRAVAELGFRGLK